MIWLDFETRSECDLKTAGVYNYARHRSTQVLCMSWAYENEPVETWRPSEAPPNWLMRSWDNIQIRAHNAAFERLIFWHVLKLQIPIRTVLLHRSASACELRAR